MSRPAPLLDNWQAILHGLLLTIGVWLAGAVLALLLGLAIALLVVFGPAWIRRLSRAYVTVFRGVPFLIQLFLLYYGGPRLGLTLSPMTAGVIGLSVYGSAYFAEIFRAGFASVPSGQIEAARAMGLRRGQIIRHIELPQMIVVILPALANMAVVLIKETAVLSVISVDELTSVVSEIGATTFAFAETLTFLALVYWALLEATTSLAGAVERRVGAFATSGPR
jgi:polar amino acid transport system permease protein